MDSSRLGASVSLLDMVTAFEGKAADFLGLETISRSLKFVIERYT